MDGKDFGELRKLCKINVKDIVKYVIHVEDTYYHDGVLYEINHPWRVLHYENETCRIGHLAQFVLWKILEIITDPKNTSKSSIPNMIDEYFQSERRRKEERDWIYEATTKRYSRSWK